MGNNDSLAEEIAPAEDLLPALPTDPAGTTDGVWKEMDRHADSLEESERTKVVALLVLPPKEIRRSDQTHVEPWCIVQQIQELIKMEAKVA